MNVRWTHSALRDLEAIGDSVAKDKPGAASRLVGAIFDRTGILILHPETGRPGRIAGTRELVVSGTPYVVPYRVRAGDVEILAVFHGARRRPPALD